MTALDRTRKCSAQVRRSAPGASRSETHTSFRASSIGCRTARQRRRLDTGGIDSHAGTTCRGRIEPTHELRIVPTEGDRRDAQLTALRTLLLPD